MRPENKRDNRDKKNENQHRINRDIRAREVRVVGDNVEPQVLSIEAALKLADELADVLFVLICLANQTGIDLNDALIKNLDKKTIRDAERHKNNEKLAK